MEVIKSVLKTNIIMGVKMDEVGSDRHGRLTNFPTLVLNIFSNYNF